MNAAGLVVCALPALAGCAATVTPPDEPPQPRPAYIVDHGQHATLVVVDSGGRPVRYAFGELGRYSDGDFGFFRGMGALLLPADPHTLGRRVLDGEPTPDNILENIGVSVENLHCIAVPGERADRLQRMLNLAFEERLSSARYNAGWNLEFVENPQDYWFGTSANEAVENWLEELGCTVSGNSSFGKWKVVQPQGGLPAVCAERE